MSSTTTSISVSNSTKTGYNFADWSYTNDNKKRSYPDKFQIVAYKGKATPLEEPFKPNYAFDGWEVKYETRVLIDSDSNTEKVLAPGSKFDFDTMKVIDNITIRARFKHAHEYAYLPLTELIERYTGFITQEDVDKYNSYLHFRICVNVPCGDYSTKPHEFDKDGVCYYCGLEEAEVTV